MAIEFRIEGKDSDLVAEELKVHVKTLFGVEATIRSQPKRPVRGGLVELVVLILHVAITAHAAYEKYVQQPYDNAVAKWRDLVFFAKEKRPTMISAIIGKKEIPLDQGDPEELHKLTRSALDSATVTTE